jgi:secreted PhoX family phosphatase
MAGERDSTEHRNFCVPVDRGADDPKGGQPIVVMGRFVHEAVATDHRTGVVYQTDDPGRGVGAGFYRYLPDEPEALESKAGALRRS